MAILALNQAKLEKIFFILIFSAKLFWKMEGKVAFFLL